MSSAKNFYLPSLDGFRAIAALLVFVSHAGWGDIVPGGFGVTMFFFLSGYLITTLLRREFEISGDISLKHFYLRRMYRIWPSMYLVLFSILALGLLGVVPSSFTWPGLLSQMFQVTNYYFLMAPVQNLVYATHTFWSLAVEEHFYLVFPLFMLSCVRRWNYADVAKILLAICVLELAWRCVLVFGLHAPTDRIFLATDTRLDSLLFGCILGLWKNPALDAAEDDRGNLSKIAVLCCAIATLLFTFIFRNQAFRDTLRYTLQGLALFPIFWLAVRHPKWAALSLLNSAPARMMGKLSYTFYLCHFLFIKLAAQLFSGSAVSALAAFAMSLAFAYLVYRTVEIPFGRLRRQLHDEQQASAAGGVALAGN